MNKALLSELVRLREQHEAVVVVTDLASGAQCLVRRNELEQTGSMSTPAIAHMASGSAELHEAIGEAASAAFRDDRSRRVALGERDFFFQVHNPPLRMMIVGAVHISQALAPMAQLAGYAVTVIDPRRAFANDVRFPKVAMTTEWPDDALRELEPDRRTAIVTLTHDPKLDDPALHVALRSEAFYIGCLGSRRTHALRLERLTEQGFEPDVLERIHGPIGLNIGAKSPAEIAVSIMGEVTQSLRSAS
jgi:xanthine dehydrogenase accessory factor